MVCVVLCGFVVCWSPFQVAILYSQFGHTASETGEVNKVQSLKQFLAHSSLTKSRLGTNIFKDYTMLFELME